MKTRAAGKRISMVLGCFAYCFGSAVSAQDNVANDTQGKNKIIEIRSYNLKPGTRPDFHNLMLQSTSMLKRWKIDVVAFGPSVHDEDSYFLIRSYKDLKDRQEKEDAFYGSDEWKKGPREAVLALILNYTTIVVPVDYLKDKIMNEAISGNFPQSDDRAQLTALNAKFIRNFITNDTVSHAQIIHKNFIYISATGKIVKRPEYMKRWAHGFDNKVDKSFEYKDEVIRIFGDMALIRCNAVASRLENGKLVYDKTVYTDTYVKEGGKWLCVQAQITAAN